MSTHRISLFALAILLAMLISACGGGSEEPAAAPAAVEAVAVVAAPLQEPVQEVAPTGAPVEAVAETAPVADAAPAEASAAASTRTFAVTAGGASTVQYNVEEEFFGRAVPFVTAIGTTNQVEGTLQLAINGGSVQVADGSFRVDLTTLTSDSSRRDNAIRRDWLQSNTFPLATFSNIQIVNLPAGASEGQDVTFQLAGDLTVRNIAVPVVWDTTARLDGSTLTGTAQTNVLMADFGFSAPNIGGMLRVTDGVTLTLNIVAEEVQ